jgi:hypothetical protein
MQARYALLSAGAALGLVLAAAPASAALIQVNSPTGAYSVFYDPAQPAIISAASGFEGTFFNVDGQFQGAPENDGLDNGIQQTTFSFTLRAKFVPNPGFAFTSLEVDDAGQIGFHHGFFGGEVFDETTTITPLNGGPAIVLNGPHVANFPPFGQGGGGAYDRGFVFGSPMPPPGGFWVDMLQTVTLFDNSSLGIGRVEFFLGIGPAAAAGVPEPAAWALMIAGFGGVGAVLRRRRLAAV